jgi:hypothetical protein
MDLAVVFAIAGALVAATFAAQLARQWVAKRRHHALAWTFALSLYAVGMVALAIGFGTGWTPVVYGTYWLTGALLNVPLLAVGQLHLVDPRRAVLWWTFAGLFTVWAFGAISLTGMDHEALLASGAGDIPAGREVLGDGLAYTVLRPFTMFGTLVVVLGCLWSGIRTKRYGILLIALGVFISATSSTFLRRDLDEYVAVVLAAGVTVMYLGFRAAGKPAKRSAMVDKQERSHSG